jgi:transmembrane sensor
VFLADSSKLTLDAETEIRVRLGRRTRELELTRGQARFDVAHDARRPFTVRADGEKVIATGTAFDIDLSGPKLLVTLIEGRLTVAPDAASTAAGEPRVVRLTSGQQLVFTPGSEPAVAPVDLQRATSWERGQLVFDDDTLGAVVARINRYSKRPLRISDGATAGLKISGICDTDNIEGFVTTITEYLPVRAVEEGGEIRLESR